MTDRKLLFVRWQDHHTFHENKWRDIDEFEEVPVYEVQSIGWLVKENKNHLIVAAHCAFDVDQITGEMMILKKTIVERREIKLEQRNG